MEQKGQSKWKACCEFCNKEFDISNVGVSVLLSHVSGKKHTEIIDFRSKNAGFMFYSRPLV